MGWAESDAESKDDRPPADEDDEDGDSIAATDNGEDDEDDPPAKMADTAPVVPVALCYSWPAAHLTPSIISGPHLLDPKTRPIPRSGRQKGMPLAMRRRYHEGRADRARDTRCRQ